MIWDLGLFIPVHLLYLQLYLHLLCVAFTLHTAGSPHRTHTFCSLPYHTHLTYIPITYSSWTTIHTIYLALFTLCSYLPLLLLDNPTLFYYHSIHLDPITFTCSLPLLLITTYVDLTRCRIHTHTPLTIYCYILQLPYHIVPWCCSRTVHTQHTHGSFYPCLPWTLCPHSHYYHLHIASYLQDTLYPGLSHLVTPFPGLPVPCQLDYHWDLRTHLLVPFIPKCYFVHDCIYLITDYCSVLLITLPGTHYTIHTHILGTPTTHYLQVPI